MKKKALININEKLSHLHKRSSINPTVLISALLLTAVLVVFFHGLDNDFLVYHDDGEYILENHNVRSGMTIQNALWAFKSIYAANWHPLTWISHQLDVELFGLNPRGHHRTNLMIHMANVLLLFILFRHLTGKIWHSGFVAMLFAIHPLHVESVAWVAERKDLLSAFFWILTMGGYVHYTQKPSIGRYISVVLAYMAGLLAKPMLVTLPLVLLLLDYWPLGRVSSIKDLYRNDGSRHGKTGDAGTSSHPRVDRKKTGRRTLMKTLYSNPVLDKIPLLALAAASSIVTLTAQMSRGAIGNIETYPFHVRVENALVAYIEYILKMLWPQNLAVLYSHPGYSIPQWQVIGAACLLAAMTGASVYLCKKRPYLLFGWFWYLGTLVPVIGIIQVGDQAYADRYTYLPLIGLFVMIVWGISDALPATDSREGLEGKRTIKNVTARGVSIWVLSALAIAGILALMKIAHTQVGYFRDTITAYEHALQVTRNKYLVNNEMGCALVMMGKPREAERYYREAIRIKPDFGIAHHNLAVYLALQGRFSETWEEVHLAKKYNKECSAIFLNRLETRMPDPNKER